MKGPTIFALLTSAALSIFSARATARNKPPQMLAAVMDLYGYTSTQQSALMAVLHLYKTSPPSEFPSHEAANDWFKNATQLFLRRGERWDPKNIALDARLEPHRERLLAACHTLGMIDQEKPLVKTPYIIIPGALDTRVYKRIKALVAGIKEGALNPDATILFLTCQERVLQEAECPQLTSNRTERGMAEYLWEQAKREHLVLTNLTASFISGTPKQDKTRADTEDTAIAMRTALNNTKAALTVVIEQPYKNRFASTFQRTNNNPFHFYSQKLDTQTDDFKLFILPDNIGRDIYGQFQHVMQFCRKLDQALRPTSAPT